MNRSDRPRQRGAWPLATLLVPALFAAAASVTDAQVVPASGRFSLYTGWSEQEASDGSTSDLTEVIATLSLRPRSGSDETFDYALDVRVAGYPSADRDQRVSIYEAFVGLHSRSGRWSARLGQMWIQELGGLGSVGGVHGEYRLPTATAFGLVRVGLFAGLEPERHEAGYVEDVRKGGVYAAVDGSHGRRHVLGYVMVRNSDLTERSVVVFNNYVPVARTFHLYQALEYDTKGPGDLGEAELSYFFANLRYSPAKIVDLQATYHRGRSVDSRSITRDQLDGRPVSPEALEGLLFESSRLRITVHPTRHLSLWATYGQDQNNRGDASRDRLQFGASARNLFDSGFDITLASSQTSNGDDSYDSLHASIGTGVGSRVYLSLDYNESLAVYHYDDGDGGTIEVHPESSRYSLSSNLNLNRTLSFLLVIGVGIPVGVIAATQRNSKWDYLSLGMSTALAAVPSFVLAFGLLLVFAVWLDWFPVRLGKGFGRHVVGGLQTAQTTAGSKIRRLRAAGTDDSGLDRTPCRMDQGL